MCDPTMDDLVHRDFADERILTVTGCEEGQTHHNRDKVPRNGIDKLMVV
jgi:hypothetical protein